MEQFRISPDAFRQGIMSTQFQYMGTRYIPGVPEITEQSIQSIFQEFALIKLFF